MSKRDMMASFLGHLDGVTEYPDTWSNYLWGACEDVSGRRLALESFNPVRQTTLTNAGGQHLTHQGPDRTRQRGESHLSHLPTQAGVYATTLLVLRPSDWGWNTPPFLPGSPALQMADSGNP